MRINLMVAIAIVLIAAATTLTAVGSLVFEDWLLRP